MEHLDDSYLPHNYFITVTRQCSHTSLAYLYSRWKLHTKILFCLQAYLSDNLCVVLISIGDAVDELNGFHSGELS